MPATPMQDPKGQTRADDDALLYALRLRVKGIQLSQIARRLRINVYTLRSRMERVVERDLIESGETRAAVLQHYWRGAE